MDVPRIMGPGAENDWVYLGNTTQWALWSYHRRGNIWVGRWGGFCWEEKILWHQRGVLEGILGYLLYSCWVHFSYYPTGLIHMLAGLCWKQQTWRWHHFLFHSLGETTLQVGTWGWGRRNTQWGQSWLQISGFVLLPSNVAASCCLYSLARCSLGASCRRREDFLLGDAPMGRACCFLIYCCCWKEASWALGFPRHIWTAREDLGDLVSPNNNLSVSLSLVYIKIRQS